MRLARRGGRLGGCAAPGVAGALKEHTCPPFWKIYRDDNDPGVRVFTVRPDGTYATSIFAESDC